MILVSSKSKQISIASLGGLIDKVMIFDTAAKRLYESKCRKSGIRGFKFDCSATIVVCEVVLADGTSIVKR
jgi:hypothetical protein